MRLSLASVILFTLLLFGCRSKEEKYLQSLEGYYAGNAKQRTTHWQNDSVRTDSSTVHTYYTVEILDDKYILFKKSSNGGWQFTINEAHKYTGFFHLHSYYEFDISKPDALKVTRSASGGTSSGGFSSITTFEGIKQ